MTARRKTGIKIFTYLEELFTRTSKHSECGRNWIQGYRFVRIVISTVITDPEGLSALPSIIPQKLGRQTKPSPDRYGFVTNPLVTVKMVQVLKPTS